MIKFDAATFYWLILTIAQFEESCKKMDQRVPEEFKQKTRRDIEQFLRRLDDPFQKIGLRFSKKQVNWMLEDLKDVKCDLVKIGQSFEELLSRISDEIEDKFFFDVEARKIEYYEKPRNLFGWRTIEKFSSIALEVEEAGKCYAVGRHTACAFHLMRVMEVGVRVLGKSLGLSTTNRSWDAILTKCDKELQKPTNDRSPEWRTDDRFFSEATANLRAVKDAWRNPTMHIEHIYDEEKALDLSNAVRAFMRHLATKLSETNPDA
jgi:hypothetical protein